MAKSKYGKTFITGNLEVRWSHLSAPDEKFGNPNHSITVKITPELKSILDKELMSLGGKKINGLKEDLIKFKNTLKIKEGVRSFPITGSDASPSEQIPMSSDIVRLRVTPSLLSRDDSVSFYLEAVQLVQKNFSGTSSNQEGFAPVVDSPF